MAGGNTESPLGDAIRRRAELSGVDNLRQHTARGTLVNWPRWPSSAGS